MRYRITERDEDILAHLIQGASNEDIAKQTYCSPRTVKQHIRRMFWVTGTDNRVELALWKLGTRAPEKIVHPVLNKNPRMEQCARFMVAGRTNQQIAALMGTTEQVIKNYGRKIYDIFGVWSKLELAIMLGVPDVPKDQVRGQAVGVGKAGSHHGAVEQEEKGHAASVRVPSVQQRQSNRVASGA